MAHEHHSHEHNHGGHGHDEEKLSVYKLIGSALLLATGIVLEKVPAFHTGGIIFTKLGVTETYVRGAFLACFFASYILCGLPVLKEAVENIFKGNIFDEEFLMAVASVGALVLGETAEAVTVMFLFQLGEFLEDKAVDKSKDSIAELMNIRPDKATVIRNGNEITVVPEEINVGETIIVKPGERIALDGIIVEGSSFADTSALTGESVPKEIITGSEVLSGFINTTGVIKIKTTKPYAESAASRILELVQNAQEKKSKSEQFITRFSRIYTPSVCGLALLVALIPPLFAAGQTFTDWIYRALMFLVVSCPCALVISVPLTFFAGLGNASSKGILIKGASYLEKLSKTSTVVFDKTGTLTKGVFSVTAIHSADSTRFSEEEILAAATHAEYYSTHPISRSLKNAHHCEKCDTVKNGSYEEISGQGIRTVFEGKTILAGNMRLMNEQKVTGIADCNEDDTGTIVHIAIDGTYAGHIVISDEVKQDSANAVALLKKAGIKKTVLLTGDSESAAEKVGRILNMDKVFSELLPGDKVTQLENLLAEMNPKKETLVFAGDGINDAPVITRADVGIAMGALGSDAAIEAADVVIMDDKPSRTADAVTLSKKTMRIVKQNIVFSLAVKAAIMALSAAGVTDMWVAVFGDVGVTMIAILNALRVFSIR